MDRVGDRPKLDSKLIWFHVENGNLPSRIAPKSAMMEEERCKETIMSKTRILLMEAGVVLKEVKLESGPTILAKAYSVSTRRTPEVWPAENLEQALKHYNEELERCTSLAGA